MGLGQNPPWIHVRWIHILFSGFISATEGGSFLDPTMSLSVLTEERHCGIDRHSTTPNVRLLLVEKGGGLVMVAVMYVFKEKPAMTLDIYEFC